MRVFRGFQPLSADFRGSVAAIGNFDGLHRGHRAVVTGAASLAREISGSLSLITFEPHPKSIVQPQARPARLMPIRHKLEILRDWGVAQVIFLPFAERLRQMPPENFIDGVLSKAFGLRGVVTGQDFRFGYRRQGDIRMLAEHGRRAGIESRAVEPVIVEGAPCSSSAIRQALKIGDVATVTTLMGRPFEIVGIVRPGDRRGRTLGFPTANTYPLPTSMAMPAVGIYTVKARLLGQEGWLDAVASLGSNPTFGANHVRLEVFVLDRNDLDLYAQRLQVRFLERIRGEERYDSVDALVAQIAKDCEQARRTHARLRSSSDRRSQTNQC